MINPIKSLYRIFAVPLFQDNYSYILQTGSKDPLFLVDPANPEVILQCLLQYFPKNQVGYILYTHKHFDHAGGSQGLYDALKSPNLKILSGKNDAEQIKTVNMPIEEDCQVKFNGSRLNIFNVPCHTRGHVIYHFKEKEGSSEFEDIREQMKTSQGKLIKQFKSRQCAFTGDTLFSGGIGRFFEGNAPQMFNNLTKIVNNLHPSCHIYNGHEYTLQNLKWGAQIEPENSDLNEYLQFSEKESCTLPTTLEREKKVNVFLRSVTGTPLQEKITNDKVNYLRILRDAKNEGSINLHDFIK